MSPTRVTHGLRETVQDLSELLGELLTYGPIGVRREVDMVMRDLEMLPGGLFEAADSVAAVLPLSGDDPEAA